MCVCVCVCVFVCVFVCLCAFCLTTVAKELTRTVYTPPSTVYAVDDRSSPLPSEYGPRRSLYATQVACTRLRVVCTLYPGRSLQFLDPVPGPLIASPVGVRTTQESVRHPSSVYTAPSSVYTVPGLLIAVFRPCTRAAHCLSPRSTDHPGVCTCLSQGGFRKKSAHWPRVPLIGSRRLIGPRTTLCSPSAHRPPYHKRFSQAGSAPVGS